jgi:hypothetical protein
MQSANIMRFLDKCQLLLMDHEKKYLQANSEASIKKNSGKSINVIKIIQSWRNVVAAFIWFC